MPSIYYIEKKKSEYERNGKTDKSADRRGGQKMYLRNIGSIDQCCRRTRWPLTLNVLKHKSQTMACTLQSTFHHFTMRLKKPTVRMIRVHVREWFFYSIEPFRFPKEKNDLLNNLESAANFQAIKTGKHQKQ